MAQTLPTFDSENTQVRFPADPTRLPSGISTRRKGHQFGNMPLPDPFKTFNQPVDFTSFVASDWTITAVGGGTSALSLLGDYGALLLTTTAAAGDNVCLQALTQVRTALVTPAVGKRLWFSTRFQVDDATNAAVVAGLYTTDTTPISSLPTDGIYFSKPAAGTAINFVVSRGGTATSVALPVPIVAATNIELSFFFNPRESTVVFFINGQSAGGVVTTNLPNSANALRLSFAVQAGTAVVRTALLDNLFVANDR